jgi:hypothetical protein
MSFYIDPNEVSSAQPNDNEGIEQIETTNGRENKQIHGSDARRLGAVAAISDGLRNL